MTSGLLTDRDGSGGLDSPTSGDGGGGNDSSDPTYSTGLVDSPASGPGTTDTGSTGDSSGSVSLSNVSATFQEDTTPWGDDTDEVEVSARVRNPTDDVAGMQVEIGGTTAATLVEPIASSKTLSTTLNAYDVRSFGGGAGQVTVAVTPVTGWNKTPAGSTSSTTVTVPAEGDDQDDGPDDAGGGAGAELPEETPFRRRGAAPGSPGGAPEQRPGGTPRTPSEQPGRGIDVDEPGGDSRRAPDPPDPDPTPSDQQGGDQDGGPSLATVGIGAALLAGLAKAGGVV